MGICGTSILRLWLCGFMLAIGAIGRAEEAEPADGPAAGETATSKSALIDALARHGAAEVVFATRRVIEEHWYANFGYLAPGPNQKLYRDGGRLCCLDLRTGQLTVLLDDPAGGVRDPQVHYDGKKVLFSYRKGGTPNYLLYEIGIDGTGLRQLTSGPWDDLEPSYLPDGGIVFVSSRARRWVQCWLSQVAVIHRCNGDGEGVRALSANVEQDNTPAVLADGRLLYTRWEYVDRSQVHFHHLWTMNPDGTEQTVYFGNLHPGDVYLDAKAIPGSDRIVFIRSPGHGRMEHQGHVATVGANRGPDDKAELRDLTRSDRYRDPWAVTPDLFLAAQEKTLVALNGRDEPVVLFTLPDEFGDAWLHEPRPLQARSREPLIPARVDLSRPTGRFLLQDVHLGRNMAGVAQGEIKKLLVLESLPKPINFTGGMDPLSYKGTFTLERVLGVVPVEPDGSAYFEAPALRSLVFVALDEHDLAVKRMQSFTTIQPGETLGCIGCHERRSTTTPVGDGRQALAARRAPSRIEPLPDAPDVLDFPRDIQPVLDRHCIECHDADRRDGRVSLAGDRGPMFSHAYYALTVTKQLADGRNMPRSNYKPRTLGSGGSPLMKKIDEGHHGVKLTPNERDRIRLWLDVGAPYPGAYAALASGTIGGYEKNEEVLENDTAWATTRAARPVLAARCNACHTTDTVLLPQSLADEIGLSFWEPDMNDPRLMHNRHMVFNLTRPDKSLYLLAPLSRCAGGLGLCNGPHDCDGVFASADDPAYRTLLAMIEAGARRLAEVKRFDMPGFQPRPEWFREMKRFGVLAADFDPAKQSVDPYAVERRYWDLFVYGRDSAVRGLQTNSEQSN
jgi:hypothetical protein